MKGYRTDAKWLLSSGEPARKTSDGAVGMSLEAPFQDSLPLSVIRAGLATGQNFQLRAYFPVDCFAEPSDFRILPRASGFEPAETGCLSF
eukprot:1160439-Amphidinium_carterae.1